MAGQEDASGRPEGAAPDGLRSRSGLTAAQVHELRQVVEELVHILVAPEHFGAAERERVLQHARAVLQAPAPPLGTEETVTWHQECDFPPVVEASFVPIEGLPEREEPHNHATVFGLAQVELEDGEEQGPQGIVYLFHPGAFDQLHWEVLGYCVRKKSYETARAFPLDESQEARAYARGLAVAILTVLEAQAQRS